MSIYVNGVLSYTFAITNWNGDTTPIIFGSYTNILPGILAYIDDMRLYPYVLSASQIKLMYNELPDYTFRLKASCNRIPTFDTNNNILTNVGYTTTYNDPIRDYVFNFSGSNSLSISMGTPVNSTKSFWLSTAYASNAGGNIFGSANYPIALSSSKVSVIIPSRPNLGTKSII